MVLNKDKLIFNDKNGKLQMNTNDFFNKTTGDKHMSIKLAFITMCFALAIATPSIVMAGGSHGGHGSSGGSAHKKPVKRVYSEEYAPHAEGHEHDAGESPVGRPAAQQEVTMTVDVVTFDTMRYAFSSDLKLKSGDVVKFVITNKGKIPHEFSIGDEAEQAEHREMVRKMPNMVHQDASTVTIKPGETQILAWKFNTADVVIACNIPGHFEAGMFKNITLN